jgi:hypothetical protein
MRLDLTGDPLPRVDVVLCRDCLVHLSFQNIFRAFANLRRSGSRYAGSPSWRRISCWTIRRSSSKNRPIGRVPCRTRPRPEIARRPRPGAAIARPRPARRHACSCRKWAGPRVFFPQCGQVRTLNAACFLRFTFGIGPPGPPGWTDAPVPRRRETASRRSTPFASRGSSVATWRHGTRDHRSVDPVSNPHPEVATPEAEVGLRERGDVRDGLRDEGDRGEARVTYASARSVTTSPKSDSS